MPVFNGHEIISKLRELNSEAYILFYSAKQEQEFFIKAIELGANDFILKPFKLFEFHQRIKLAKQVQDLKFN